MSHLPPCPVTILTAVQASIDVAHRLNALALLRSDRSGNTGPGIEQGVSVSADIYGVDVFGFVVVSARIEEDEMGFEG